MMVSKNATICVTPNTNATICVTPWPTPNMNRWNIGRVGSPMQNSRVGHVHFHFFGVDFIRVESRFSVEYGLKTATQICWEQN